MSGIVRVSKREDPWARIPKAVLGDKSLSWKAKGLLSYLLGKPNDWKLRVGDLMKQSTDGEVAVYSGLNELRTAGYAILTSTPRVNGQFVGNDWVIYDSPHLGFPDAGKPDLDKPDLENLDLSKSEETKNDLTKNEETVLLSLDPHRGSDNLPPEGEASESPQDAPGIPAPISPSAAPKPVSPEILAIYDAYPRKVGRQDAIKAIRNALKVSGLPAATMLERVQLYAKICNDPREFMPHPATWFNRGSYSDDPKEWVRQDLRSTSAARSASSTSQMPPWKVVEVLEKEVAELVSEMEYEHDRTPERRKALHLAKGKLATALQNQREQAHQTAT